ncbi:MAG: YhjD/YihY/BrkB family envelope integrity protein, partial [Polyangiaceae bacterium]
MLLRSLELVREHPPRGPVSTWRLRPPRRILRALAAVSDKGPGTAVEVGAGPLDLVRCLWRRLDANRSFGVAAEMAFWLFSSLVPLVAVAGMVAAKLTLKNWSAMAPLIQSLPYSTRSLVLDELPRLAAWNGGKVGVWAGLVFVWLASSGVHAVFDGIEIQGDVPEAERRPWWKKRLYAIGTCVAMSVGVGLLSLLGAGVDWLWRITHIGALLEASETASTVLGQALRAAVGAAVSLGLIAGLYWMGMPRRMRRDTPILPGALAAIGLQIVVGLGYSLYLSHGGESSAYTAQLAVVGVTMMAIYFFCTMMLAGVEVNQMLAEHRR